jgi:hypothetical protein
MPLVPLAGAINGVNLVYATPWAYTPGTVAVFLNGVLLSRNDGAHPWTETNPSLGTVTLNGSDYTPKAGDSLFAFATMFGESIASELIVGEIYAMLQSETDMAAFLDDELTVSTVVSSDDPISVLLTDQESDAVVVSDSSMLASTECDEG